jgi:CRISPR-associated endonuclease/helicase Cas3
MYFNNIEKFKLEEFVVNSDIILAHIHEERKETLREHIELSLKYLFKIIESKQLDNVFINLEDTLINDLSDEGKILYREMLMNTVYMHDLGKINCNFQYKKMKNMNFENAEGLVFNNSNHSMLSSLIYLNHYFIKIQKHLIKGERNTLRVFMLLNAYVISKHHGDLDSFVKFRNKFLDCDGEGEKLYTEQASMFNRVYLEPIKFNEDNKLLKRLFDNFDRVLAKEEEQNKYISIVYYIYERFLSSILLACDYYATSSFKNNMEINTFGEINDIEKFYGIYKNTKIYQNIREYEKESYGKISDFDNIKDINILRNELFLDAERSMLKNIDKNIFYLEAPTGSGKSNVAFNLSFKMVEKFKTINKIFYVYPFNTLIEQNMNTLEKVFENSSVINEIAVINSVVPIKVKDKNIDNVNKNEDSDVLDKNYEVALLDRQFLHYPIVLTTHVSIFNYLFGSSKDNLFPLAQIANSIIILDEIQSYKNSIWKEIITFLKYYSEILNIKFIIMSATLPNLNKLIDGEIKTVNLIENRKKYFENPIFKNRVIPDFTLLEEKENILDILFKHVIDTASKEKGNILIEFIKKDTASIFHKKLKDYYETCEYGEKKQVELITGDDNSIDRNIIIDKIKDSKNVKNIILVATQVIEAGVDIDMDIGYKDISMLDSEEQFLGRINRSCNKKQGSKVYFFDLDPASDVYKNDVRKEKSINLTCENIRQILINKNFGCFYDYVLKELNKQANKLNDKNFIKFINEDVNTLDFKKIEDRMKLIDERYEYSVFLNRTIKDKDKILDGKKIWQDYISLLKDNSLDYSEKKVKLSMITSKLNYFIYKVDKKYFTYQDRIGDMYYIEDGEKYLTDGKLDREKFNTGNADLFM